MTNSSVDHKRMKLLMACFDKLPYEQRNWISNLSFSIADEHIFRGTKEIAGCKEYLENGGRVHWVKGNGQN